MTDTCLDKEKLWVKINKFAERCDNGDVMVKSNRLKITVLKKTDSKQIFGDNPPSGQAIEACSVFKEGQEFIVNEDVKMPEGFCPWAWNDINKKVITLMFGGNFPWMKEEGTSVSCCTDGFKPVIFEIRRIT
ncbi:MAG: TIGR04076 family protein [Candidatus Bathyarchaeota archaeon]|jgi:uncharacterized repeat protein (TIGR04076 family)